MINYIVALTIPTAVTWAGFWVGGFAFERGDALLIAFLFNFIGCCWTYAFLDIYNW